MGGGGRDLAEIVRLGLVRLAKKHPHDPEAVLVATAITMESVATLTALASDRCAEALCVDALSLDVSERAPLGPATFLKPLHRIHIFVFRPGPALAAQMPFAPDSRA